jgi:hypothetical protein
MKKNMRMASEKPLPDGVPRQNAIHGRNGHNSPDFVVFLAVAPDWGGSSVTAYQIELT